jgi:hypothetical protein
MTTNRSGGVARPLRIGWSLGLLTLAAVVFASTFLPALLVWSLGGNAVAGGTAMSGGLVAGWLAYLSILRLGRRRGWWAWPPRPFSASR